MARINKLNTTNIGFREVELNSFDSGLDDNLIILVCFGNIGHICDAGLFSSLKHNIRQNMVVDRSRRAGGCLFQAGVVQV